MIAIPWIISGLATVGSALALGIGKGHQIAEDKYYGPDWDDDPNTIIDNIERGFRRFTTLDVSTKFVLAGLLFTYYKFYELKVTGKRRKSRKFRYKGKNWEFK